MILLQILRNTQVLLTGSQPHGTTTSGCILDVHTFICPLTDTKVNECRDDITPKTTIVIVIHILRYSLNQGGLIITTS